MRYGLLVALVGLGLVYFFGEVAPTSWSGSGSMFSAIDGAKSLGSSVGTAFERAADQF
jgi:hypothetical protein